MIHNEGILTSTSETVGTKGKKKHIGQQKGCCASRERGNQLSKNQSLSTFNLHLIFSYLKFSVSLYVHLCVHVCVYVCAHTQHVHACTYTHTYTPQHSQRTTSEVVSSIMRMLENELSLYTLKTLGRAS